MTRNRLHSIERIFILADILRASTSGVSASHLNRVAGERIGRHNVRTTFRDLRLMERLGQVKHDGHGSWQWVQPTGARRKRA